MSRTLCLKATARAALGAIACVAAALVAGIADAATESLDPSFGNSGRVTTAVAGRDAAIEAMALQADGKIVAVGWSRDSDSSAFPPRMDFLADWSTTWTAASTLPSGTPEEPQSPLVPVLRRMLLRSRATGRCAGGFTWDFPGRFALARFNSDGTLDSTFGTAGKVITDIGQANNAINAIAIQPDGKILAAGGNGDGGDTAQRLRGCALSDRRSPRHDLRERRGRFHKLRLRRCRARDCAPARREDRRGRTGHHAYVPVRGLRGRSLQRKRDARRNLWRRRQGHDQLRRGGPRMGSGSAAGRRLVTVGEAFTSSNDGGFGVAR